MAGAQVSQAGRRLSVDTPLGSDLLLINHFSGSESISGLFHIRLDLLADARQTISFDELLGRNITVTLQLNGGNQRYFQGILGRIAQGNRDERWRHYQADVYPWLWLLTLEANCRIYQDKSIPDIIKSVFEDLKAVYPEVSYRNALTGEHIPLDYCVQYRETDFNFVSRLMEQEGIFYFFEHEQNKHTLVLADVNGAIQDCPFKSSFNYMPEGGYGDREDTISDWQAEQQLRSGRITMRDHDFEVPAKSLEVNEPTTIKVGNYGGLEIFDYPGEYASRFNVGRAGQVQDEGRKLVRMRMEEEEFSARTFRGSSDSRYFVSGHKFALQKHFQDDGDYVLTGVSYSTPQSPDYLSGGQGAGPHHCTFVCVDAKTTIRPARLTPKPFVQGPQTAVVTVPNGEEIYTDKYGRVRVQFFWDRLGKNDETSACWVRVAQPWAGSNWGAHFWPRVGQEVVVEFLEGDPDQPIITGSVYNADQMPPYSLPDNQTRSGIQSRSSKGGGVPNFNELRFEDKMGSEQLFLHAEKDMDVSVENDSREMIGANRSLIVTSNQLEQVQADKHGHVKGNHFEKIDGDMSLKVGGGRMEKTVGDHSIEVEGDQKEKLGGNVSLKIGGDQKEQVGGNLSLQVGQSRNEQIGQTHAMEAGQTIYLKGGMTVVIEAGMELSLKAPGGFVDIGPAGVTIQGIMVLINSGGSAASGPGVSVATPDDPQAPFDPDDPDTADDGSKGGKM